MGNEFKKKLIQINKINADLNTAIIEKFLQWNNEMNRLSTKLIYDNYSNILS